MTSDEALKELNDGASVSILCMRLIASLAAAEHELECYKTEVPRLRVALRKCYVLFSEIRNDWTDPRSQCREGWRIIDAALKGPSE